MKHKYEEEWEAIAREAMETDPGQPMTLEAMKERNTRNAYRLIYAAVAEFRNTAAMPEKDVRRIMCLAGRVYGPIVIYDLDRYKVIDPAAYAPLVPYAWTRAEWPGTSLDIRIWRRLWKKAGFTIDGQPAPHPDAPVKVYRAAWPKYKHFMSWTDSLEIAKRFLRVGYRVRQHLYQTTAQPENLLAYLHEEGRNESEWIVDTRKLEIRELKNLQGVTSAA